MPSPQSRVSASRRVVWSLLVAGSTLLGACTTIVQPAPHPQQRVVVHEVPAPVVEVVPAAPAPNWHWVPGHWAWRDGNWHWMAGHYVAAPVPPMPAPVVELVPAPPSPAHVWIRGHWYWGERGWVWARGSWTVRG